MIPRTEECPSPGIPDSKRKIAQKPLRRVLAPPFVGAKDQLTVTDLAQPSSFDAERGDQLVSIVYPGVGGNDHVAESVHQRKLFIKGFGRRPEHPMPQTNRPIAPNARRVRTAVGDTLDHPVQIHAVGGSPVQAIEPDDSTHSATASSASSGV